METGVLNSFIQHDKNVTFEALCYRLNKKNKSKHLILLILGADEVQVKNDRV